MQKRRQDILFITNEYLIIDIHLNPCRFYRDAYFFLDEHHRIFQAGSFCDHFRKVLYQPFTVCPVELYECVTQLHCLNE